MERLAMEVGEIVIALAVIIVGVAVVTFVDAGVRWVIARLRDRQEQRALRERVREYVREQLQAERREPGARP